MDKGGWSKWTGTMKLVGRACEGQSGVEAAKGRDNGNFVS